MNEAAAPGLDALQSLLLLYFLILLVNAGISALLWRKSGVQLYRFLLAAWLTSLVNFVATGAMVGKPSIAAVLVFSLIFPVTASVAAILSEIVGFRLPLRPMLWGLAGSIALTGGLYALGAPKILYCLPVPLAVSVPGYYAFYVTLRRHWAKLTTIGSGLAFSLLLFSFHMTDFAFMHDKPWFATTAFTISIVLAFAISVFAPAAITEAALLENERLKLRLEFEGKMVQSSRMAAVGELAGGVAHEINSPLAAVRMRLSQAQELVAEGGPAEPALLAKLFDEGLKGVDRIARIVNGLRIFAGHEISGTSQTRASLAEVLESVLDVSAEKARLARTEVRRAKGIPEVRVDFPPSELTQVLVSLVSNSCDAVEPLAERWVEIGCERKGGEVLVKVTDSGRGIAPEVASKLMQPFFTTKPPGKGTGLGLSIAKGLVEKRGGGLSYAPSGGHTSFVVRLPAASG